MPNLTEAQIEQACRFLCKFKGLDPDKMKGPDFSLAKATIQWELFRKEILRRHSELQIDKAIEDATK